MDLKVSKWTGAGKFKHQDIIDDFTLMETNETTRVDNEAVRVSNEAPRVANEAIRVEMHNNLIVWEEYDAFKTYKPLNKVTYLGSAYVNTVECSGVLPTDTSNWLLISKKGNDGLGTIIENTYIVTSNGVSNIPLGFTVDVLNDTLLVFDENRILLDENINYSINANKTSIDLLGWSVDTGFTFRFQLMKNSDVSSYAMRNEVGTVQELPTKDKSNVVNSIKEINKSINSQFMNVKYPPLPLVGAKGDGVTDDTVSIQAIINAVASNGGGKIFFPIGTYLIGGELQDTAGANAQLLLPSIHAVDEKQMSISLIGEIPPPSIVSVVGNTPVPDGHVIIKSTLAATGETGSVIGAYGPVGSYANLSNISVQVQNIAFRLPNNPILSGLDLSRACTADIDNVIVDTGSYNIKDLIQPTHINSYGIRMPASDNGAHCRLGTTDVIGFYNGYQFAEHSNGQQVAAWGCYRAFEFAGSNHASVFNRLNCHHCPIIVSFVHREHYTNIMQLNIEQAPAGSWMTPLYDVDDVNNYGCGVINWHIYRVDAGVYHNFIIRGGQNLRYINLDYMLQSPPVWHDLTLQNGWTNYDGWGYPAQYCLDSSNRVWVRGFIKGGTLGSVAFNLPVGFRPYVAGTSFIGVSNGVACPLDVANGDVTIPATASNISVLFDFSFSIN